MKELKKDEMLDLITDFAFGRLSKNEAIIFESNLNKYPELKQEIIEIRNAFSKVNKEKLLQELENKTANMPYLVKQKQYVIKGNINLRKNILKLSLPIFVIIGFFLVMRQVELKDIEKENKLPESVLSAEEANIIFENVDVSYYDPYQNDFYLESGEEEIENNRSDIINNSSNTTIYNYMNEISESEFNELLDELDNEEFNL
ncbi:MAG: hypothetical protein CVV25_00720 [Ignavibacteriae bacterium HGW-Ignavibacteriae-4]|jgi:hypothetical protein|nr:MAG: hypothetical protein CVV25_00720 [Ignavibacteriae bacterium HGW-Ignavibacteriae-4]